MISASLASVTHPVSKPGYTAGVNAKSAKLVRLLLICLITLAGGLSTFCLASGERSHDRMPLGTATQWHVDASGSISGLDELLQREADIEWQSSQADTLEFGFSDSVYWYRMSLPAISADAPLQRYLHIPESLLNELDVVLQRDGRTVAQFKTGASRPFRERAIKHREFVFPLELSHQSPSMLYVRAQTNGSMQFEPILWERTAFTEQTRINAYASGGFYGIMLAMIFYNFFLFCIIRDRDYLYYIAFVTSFMLFSAALNGDAYQFLWPDAPAWNEVSVTLSIALIGVFSLLFSDSFLKLPQHWLAMHRIFRLMLLISVSLVLLSFVLPYPISVRLNSLHGVLVMALILTTGALMLARGFRHARYFVLAWLALLVGTTALSLSKFGILPWNPIIANGAQIGAVVEVILLSFALGDRINQERAARFQAQQEVLAASERAQLAQKELITAKESANRQLEERVAERTRELEKAMARLEAVNRFLEDVSNTDQLTKLNNRHYFVKRYHEEYRRAQRHGDTISVIMLDIDHFKHFNDTYGHLAGDQCLVAVANELRSSISRAGDTLARFGGEEFIVLLTHTNINGATTVAERLRKAVAAIELKLEQQSVSVTISLGVASIVPSTPDNPEQLIQCADEALYDAKQQGRNRVARAATPIA